MRALIDSHQSTHIALMTYILVIAHIFQVPCHDSDISARVQLLLGLQNSE